MFFDFKIDYNLWTNFTHYQPRSYMNFNAYNNQYASILDLIGQKIRANVVDNKKSMLVKKKTNS